MLIPILRRELGFGAKIQLTVIKLILARVTATFSIIACDIQCTNSLEFIFYMLHNIFVLAFHYIEMFERVFI